MSARFYTDLAEARSILLSRRELMPEVEKWWRLNGWGVPMIPDAGHAGVLCRNIATFRYEDAVFRLLAERAGLLPVWVEYVTDMYSSKSSVKRSYAQYFKCSGRGRSGGTKTQKVVGVKNANRIDGKRLSDIRMDDGVSMVDHHHSIFDRFVGLDRKVDLSNWLSGIGRARDYYIASTSIFIAHSVLFEDYHGGESGAVLDAFTSEIFEPAFDAVVRVFGVRPIIVPMPWFTEMKYYPADTNWRNHDIIPEEFLR